MKRKQGFEIIRISGEYLLIPTDDKNVCGGSTIVLNQVSAFVLDMLREQTDSQALLDALLREYDVPREVAQADLSRLLDTFWQLGLLEP